jgi:hypothetical protein
MKEKGFTKTYMFSHEVHKGFAKKEMFNHEGEKCCQEVEI